MVICRSKAPRFHQATQDRLQLRRQVLEPMMELGEGKVGKALWAKWMEHLFKDINDKDVENDRIT